VGSPFIKNPATRIAKTKTRRIHIILYTQSARKHQWEFRSLWRPSSGPIAEL
jgi:hypothetical protein